MICLAAFPLEALYEKQTFPCIKLAIPASWQNK
jgi:hypothetical protein